MNLSLTVQNGVSTHHAVFDIRQTKLIVTDEKSEQRPVIPFLIVGAGDLLWYGVRLQMDRTKTRLQHVQVRLLIGAATAAKTCLLRMEWDTRANLTDAETKHAQPHWQIDPEAFAAVTPTSFSDFARENQALGYGEVGDSRVDDLTKKNLFSSRLDVLHLAMGATFHRRNSSWSVLPNEVTRESIIYWIPACIDYLRQELAYMNRRLRPSKTP